MSCDGVTPKVAHKCGGVVMLYISLFPSGPNNYSCSKCKRTELNVPAEEAARDH